ncbi:MAG: hypothetical protein ACI8ZM_004858 [Crocinitomix sp.]|jgi:hypothetical protein
MKSDNLKYKDEILSFSPNLETFEEREIVSFRYTFDQIEHPDNFLPTYIKDEKRYKKVLLQNKAVFIGYGLSLYEDETKAKTKYLSMIGRRSTLHKKIGTHLAKGRVGIECGISDPCNEESHFTLLENAGIELVNNFEIETQLYIE